MNLKSLLTYEKFQKNKKLLNLEFFLHYFSIDVLLARYPKQKEKLRGAVKLHIQKLDIDIRHSTEKNVAAHKTAYLFAELKQIVVLLNQWSSLSILICPLLYKLYSKNQGFNFVLLVPP